MTKPAKWTGVRRELEINRSEQFRKYSWLLLLVAAFLVLYSGLFLLDVVPGRPDDTIRFWNGGEAALFWGGVLDIVGGLPALVLILTMLLRGWFKRPARDLGWLAALLILYALGVAGDLIAGIYGIGAQIGLYTTIANTVIVRRTQATPAC